MNKAPNAQRPRVICHMMASADGRIVVDRWPLSDEGHRQYEQVHASYEPDGWICGRVTMEQHFAAGTRSDEEVAREHGGLPREDFVAPGEHESFAIAVDPRGKLVWDSGDLGGDHVVAVLTHRVSDEYLAFLRAGLIDELSLLLAPVADGRIGTPALFDVEGDDVIPHRLSLEAVERRADDVLWLRYRVEPGVAGA